MTPTTVKIACPHCGRRAEMPEKAFYRLPTLYCPVCGRMQQRVFAYLGGGKGATA